MGRLLGLVGFTPLVSGPRGGRRLLRRGRRSPFPLYVIAGWSGRRFLVEEKYAAGRLAEATIGFSDEEGSGAGPGIRITATGRGQPRSEERVARRLDPWLAATVAEGRGHHPIDIIGDPERAVELASNWQTATVPVDHEPTTFRVRCEDDAWVAYTTAGDHVLLIYAERAGSVPPESLRLATVRDLDAVARDAEPRRRRRGEGG
jgi:hypothetical protein